MPSSLNKSNKDSKLSNYSGKGIINEQNRLKKAINRDSNSFASFNSNNKIIKNNTSIIPSENNKANMLDYTHKIEIMTENQKNIRESFESCTTEGKKTSNNPEFPSNSKVADDSYGQIKNTNKGTIQHKLSSVEENSYKSNRSKSQISVVKSESAGDESLPEICNSVVEDALPFKGLENHFKAISKEGFSGANDTNYMKKTNENFYSSVKSKRTDNMIISPMIINENGFPASDNNAPFEEIDDEDSNFERIQTDNHVINMKNLSSSIKKSSVENSIIASTKFSPYSKKNASNIKGVTKRRENNSKASNKGNDQQWFSFEYSKPTKTHNQYDGSHSNMVVMSNPNRSKNKLQIKNNKILAGHSKDDKKNIFNEGDTLRKGLINVNKAYEQVKSFRNQKQNEK